MDTEKNELATFASFEYHEFKGANIEYHNKNASLCNLLILYL